MSNHAASAAKAAPKSPEGVVVESAEKGGAAEKAGLKPGDVMLSWERVANPPANPKGARGKFETPFDVLEAEIEQAPRGRFEVTGRRGGETLRVEIPQGKWQLKALPILAEKELAVYRKAVETIDAGDATAGIALMRGLAGAAKERKDPGRAAWMLFKAAEALEKSRKWSEANALYAEAADYASAPRAQAHIHEAAGEAFKKQNLFDVAKKEQEEALAIREKIAPVSLAVAASLSNLGMVVETSGDFAAAEGYYQRSLAIREKLAPESLDFAKSLNNLSIVAGKRGDLEAAEAFQKRSLAIFQKLAPESLYVAASLNNLGNMARKRGDLTAAEGFYQRTLEIKEKLAPGSLGVAMSLNNLGNVARDRGNLETAEVLHRRALEIYEKLAPGSLEVAASLNNLGTVAEDRGDLTAAERYYQRALVIKEKLAPVSLDITWSLNNVGNVARARGDLAKAEEYYRRSLAIKETLAPGSLAVVASLNSLGGVAWERGDLASAESYYKRAVAIEEKLAPVSLDIAPSFDGLGLVALDFREFAAAEGHFQRALAIKEKLAPGSVAVAASLGNLGIAAEDRLDFATAEAYYQRALTIHKQLSPESLNVATDLKHLGNVATDLGDLSGAEGYYRRSLAIQEKLAPGSSAEAESSHALGDVLKKQGQKEQALLFFRRAVAALEAQRGRLGGGSATAERFSAKYADYYRDLAELEAELGQKERAFETMERFRGRALVEMLAERDLVFSEDAPEELIKEQKRADFEYDKVQGKIAELSQEKDSAQIEELLKKLGESRQKQRDVAEKIKKASPKLASLQYPEPLSLEGAKAALDPGVLFLSYSVGEETTRLFALLDGKLGTYAIPVKREDLKRDVRLLRTLLTNPTSGAAQLSKKSRDLYDILLRPARKQIEESRFVVICPDGALHALPFSVLMAGRKKYLIEEKPVSYAISATVLAQLRAPGERAHALPLAAFGDPAYPGGQCHSKGSATRGFLGGQSLLPLPATREEVNRICALFPGQAEKFLGDQATEEKAKKIGKDVRYVHFACHVLFDERFPLDSGLAFSIPAKVEEGQDNGILQAWEIFEKMRIDADLVSLSACQSGLGKEMGGEGLIGLTRAFQYAGARSVLSSLWSVSDVSTAELMKDFYGYLKAGKPKAEALRLAQVDMIQAGLKKGDRNFSHPFYWAAFVLNGT